MELLSEAFQMAGNARYPLPLPPAVSRGSNADSDVAKLWIALDQKLSGLTLQCRAIRAMLATDKKEALGLFLDTPVPPMPALSCKVATGYDATDYYVTAKEIAERAFNDRERREGRPLALLERAVRGIHAPFQLYPALEMILDLQSLPPDQFELLVSAYAAALGQISADDRSFSSCTGYALFERLLRLARFCKEHGISSQALIDAFRTYFVRHMSGTRCAESVDPEGAGIVLTRIGEMFNTHLRPFADAVPGIDKDELKPAGVGEAAAVFDYWETPQTRSLLKHVAELSYGTEEQRSIYRKPHPPDEIHAPDLLPEEVRREPAWEARAIAFLDELENWKKDQDVTEANYFHQVCSLYSSLIRAAPPGTLRDRILRSQLLLFRGAQIQRNSPPEWYSEFWSLMHLRGAGPGDLAHIRDEVRKSGGDLMVLYADLDSFEARGKP